MIVLQATVTCLAWKDDWIITGDSAGTLHFWDLKERVSRSVVTGHGAVREILFRRGKTSTRFLALFSDGVDIWDAATPNQPLVERKDSRNATKDGPLVSGIAWVAGAPLLSMATGIFHVCDERLQRMTSPIPSYRLIEQLQICNVPPL